MLFETKRKGIVGEILPKNEKIRTSGVVGYEKFIWFNKRFSNITKSSFILCHEIVNNYCGLTTNLYVVHYHLQLNKQLMFLLIEIQIISKTLINYYFSWISRHRSVVMWIILLDPTWQSHTMLLHREYEELDIIELDAILKLSIKFTTIHRIIVK